MRAIPILFMTGLLLATSFVAFQIPRVAASSWIWDSSTKVTLSERGAAGPAVAYDPALGKMIMAWVGIDVPNHSLNLISSSDMLTWSNKVTLSFSASSVAACVDQSPVDAVYDPDNSRVYVAYLEVATTGATCNANHMWVFYTSDGTTVSSRSNITSTPTCTPSCGADNQMSGPSITYDTVNHRFVVANMRVQNIGGVDNFNLFTYTSTDGVTWSGGQMVNVNPPSVNDRPDIRFINGKYFLTYNSGGGGDANILQSSDLNTWTRVSTPPFQSYGTFRISYNPAEGAYHLTWKGTGSPAINDATSSDAVSWSSNTAFEATQNEPALAYNPSSQVLLITWTGTDCCVGGSLNSEQYRIPPGSGGGGGGGSVAAGTLITLANGATIPVQNLREGMQLMSYDMTTHQFVNTTLTRFVTVVTNNTMVISTSTGKPLIVDQNPVQNLYVMFPNGTWTLLPVTEVQVGYRLFDPLAQTWVPITNIQRENGGNHVMYDIYPTSPGNYIANGYLDPNKPHPF